MNAELMLARAFAAQHPDEVARFLERLPPDEAADVLSGLEAEVAATVLSRTAPLMASAGLARLETDTARDVLEALDPGIAAGLLFRMDSPDRQKLLEALPAARAQSLRTMTEFGPRRAGGRLDPRAPALHETLTVAEVMARLREHPEGVMHYVYSVNGEHRLTGVVNMRELMLARAEAPLGTLVRRDPDALYAHDSLEVIARHAAWKRSHALPVVDREQRFLGAIRYSTFRAIETELGHAASGPSSDQTASALAELCALGASAMTRFIGTALSLEPSPPERSESRTSMRRSVLPGGLP